LMKMKPSPTQVGGGFFVVGLSQHRIRPWNSRVRPAALAPQQPNDV